MAFNGRTPAQYVDFLTREGLATRAGPVPITSYVSTGTRSPNARAVQDLFRRLLDGFSNSMFDTTRESPRRRFETYRGATLFGGTLTPGSPAVAGLNDLEQLRQRIIARGGRTSDWRRVFTGQGSIENIVDVMNFITEHREMLRSLAPATGSGPSPFAAYFTGSGEEDNLQALRRMVADEVFGLDCLGFTGSYLVWCGAEARYPEWRQHQYLRRLRFAPIQSAADIGPRTLVLWLETDVQHIAFVDSVTGRDGPAAVVTICQSSRGGPQTNTAARLVAGGSTYTITDHGHSITANKFRISGGDPALPVTGNVILANRAVW